MLLVMQRRLDCQLTHKVLRGAAVNHDTCAGTSSQYTCTQISDSRRRYYESTLNTMPRKAEAAATCGAGQVVHG